MRHTTQAVGVLATGAYAFAIGSLLLGAMLWVTVRSGAVRVFPGPGAARMPVGVIAAIAGVGICANMTGLAGARLTETVNVATLARTDVLFSLFLSLWVMHERVDRWAFLFVPVMLAGICLQTGLFARATGLGNPGDWLVLGSAFCLAVNGFLIKRAAQHVSGLVIGLCNAGVNAVVFTMATMLTSGREALCAPWRAREMVPLMILGVLTFVFFASYNTALRTLPVWEVRLLCLAAPVVAALAGWVWLHEQPSWTQWTGMTLVGGGAAGIVWLRRGGRPVTNGNTMEINHE